MRNKSVLVQFSIDRFFWIFQSKHLKKNHSYTYMYIYTLTIFQNKNLQDLVNGKRRKQSLVYSLVRLALYNTHAVVDLHHRMEAYCLESLLCIVGSCLGL